MLTIDTVRQLGNCPFCKGTISATSSEAITPCVLHTLPYCEVFDKADDALDFLQKCNAKVAN